MFSFLNYLFEIFTVAHVNEVDVGVAYSMFKADVNAGEALKYNTGDALPDFDFAKAKVEFDKLTDDEKKAAYEEYHDYVEANYKELCEAFAMFFK